jgi:hypothetical protein
VSLQLSDVVQGVNGGRQAAMQAKELEIIKINLPSFQQLQLEEENQIIQ